MTTGQSGEIRVTVFSTAALCTRLDCVRKPLRLLKRILYSYADLRRREWPRRGSGLADFLVRLTLPLYRDVLGLGLPPKRYSLVARIRLRGNRLDIDSRRYFDVFAFDRCRAFGRLRIWRQYHKRSRDRAVPAFRAPTQARGHDQCLFDVSQVSWLSMPGIYSLLFLIFPLPAVFVASGSMMLGLAGLSRCIRRRFGLDLGR